jgi:nicotinate-nucleotide adenylyltransferase
MAKTTPLGILGGTFDPIHFGHLRFAEEIATALGLDEIRLVPAGQPPHRTSPLAGSEHRLAMTYLATAGNPILRVDSREVRCTEPSYTINTVEEVRKEIGERPLCLLLGADAFFGFPFWERWQDFFKLTHIVVASRPGYELTSTLPLPLQPMWGKHFTQDPTRLAQESCGLIYHQTITSLDISASHIRALARRGDSARYLLPDSVLEYITKVELYKT